MCKYEGITFWPIMAVLNIKRECSVSVDRAIAINGTLTDL